MPPRRRKKLKVTARRSRTAYRWKSFSETLFLWAKGVLFVGSAVVLAWGALRAWDALSLVEVSALHIEGKAPAWDQSPPIKVGQPFFFFSSGHVERRLLERYPHIESVHVHRQWDRSVLIRIIPRTPVARVTTVNGWNALDAQGAVFPLEGDGVGLPILALPVGSEDTERVLAFLAALRATKESWTDGLYKLKMSPDGEAVLFMTGDWPVYWGEANIDPSLVDQKARRLQRVLSAPESALGILYARFVDDHRVVIKPRPQAVQRKASHG